MAFDSRLVPVAYWLLAGVFTLSAFIWPSLLLLLVAAVLAVGGSVVHAVDRLRGDFRTARIAAELGTASTTAAPPAAPDPGPRGVPDVPLARPYVRPPWEKPPETP